MPSKVNDTVIRWLKKLRANGSHRRLQKYVIDTLRSYRFRWSSEASCWVLPTSEDCADPLSEAFVSNELLLDIRQHLPQYRNVPNDVIFVVVVLTLDAIKKMDVKGQWTP